MQHLVLCGSRCMFLTHVSGEGGCLVCHIGHALPIQKEQEWLAHSDIRECTDGSGARTIKYVPPLFPFLHCPIAFPIAAVFHSYVWALSGH